MPLFLRANHRLRLVLVMTSGKKLAGVRSRLLAPMFEEEAQGVPTGQAEEVYQEVLGAVQVVPIAQTETARPESRWRLPEEWSQRLNRQQGKRVQVIPRTEQ